MEEEIVLEYLFGLSTDLTDFEQQAQTMQVYKTEISTKIIVI